MTNISQARGAGPSERYDAIAARFRPIFARIRERAIALDLEHDLPVAEIGLLKDAGFSTLRLPKAHGGLGLTLPEFFTLLIELSEADPNINGLDRHWRNARTIFSHNPRIYHDRIVGDFAVSGTVPAAHGDIGIAPGEKALKVTA